MNKWEEYGPIKLVMISSWFTKLSLKSFQVNFLHQTHSGPFSQSPQFAFFSATGINKARLLLKAVDCCFLFAEDCLATHTQQPQFSQLTAPLFKASTTNFQRSSHA